MVRKNSRYLIVIISLCGVFACGQSMAKSDEKDASRSVEKAILDSPSMGTADYHQAALINVELGLGYLSQGQVARAKTKLTHAIKLAPNIAETHSAMAYFLEMVGEFKDAEREHKKAVRISGKGAVYNNFGAFLCRRNRFKEADKAFHSAIDDKEYARTAEVYENAGLCALKWPDDTKATEYLTTSVQRDPNRSSVYLELTALNVKHAKFPEAKAWLDRYNNVAEQSGRSLWLGISVAKGLNDEKAVASQALILKNLFADSPEYKLYLQSQSRKH